WELLSLSIVSLMSSASSQARQVMLPPSNLLLIRIDHDLFFVKNDSTTKTPRAPRRIMRSARLESWCLGVLVVGACYPFLPTPSNGARAPPGSFIIFCGTAKSAGSCGPL